MINLSWEPLCEPIFLCISVLRVALGPRVKLASYKSALNLTPPPRPTPSPRHTHPMVYSTDRYKAVVPVLVLLFVALWLYYEAICCMSYLLALRLPCLGKRELILVLFIRWFDLHLFGFVCFLFLFVPGKDCGF